MAEAISVSGAMGAEDKVMTLETGVLANLADGAVVVTMGRTKVLVKTDTTLRKGSPLIIGGPRWRIT